MGKVTTDEDQVLEFRRDFQRELRGRIREAIQAVLGEELEARWAARERAPEI